MDISSARRLPLLARLRIYLLTGNDSKLKGSSSF
jgi:hypothetical protein